MVWFVAGAGKAVDLCTVCVLGSVGQRKYHGERAIKHRLLSSIASSLATKTATRKCMLLEDNWISGVNLFIFKWTSFIYLNSVVLNPWEPSHIYCNLFRFSKFL